MMHGRKKVKPRVAGTVRGFYDLQSSKEIRSMQVSTRLRAGFQSIPSVFLILASSGLGAVFAWASGIERGAIVACLLVLMAVGLEIAKPVAVSESMAALGRWQFGRAAMLSALALAAVVYSLTSELSLISTARADLAASREASGRPITVAQKQVADATSELTTLTVKPVATVGELEAAKANLTNDRLWKRTHECTDVTKPESVAFCKSVAEVNADLSRAQRIDELRSTVVAAQRVLSSSGLTVVKAADPGSEALAAYLGLLGVNLPSGVVGRWLLLVPVLALEIGSACALLLVPSDGVAPDTLAAKAHAHSASVAGTDIARTLAPDAPTEKPDNQPGQAPDSTERSIRERVLAKLKVAGGCLVQSTRELAFSLGCSKSALGEALAKLEGEGVLIRVAASHGKGSAIRLVGEMVA
jgi:hypothetical protein